MNKVNLLLSPDKVQLILNVLAEQPYRISMPVINDIMEQLQNQKNVGGEGGTVATT